MTPVIVWLVGHNDQIAGVYRTRAAAGAARDQMMREWPKTRGGGSFEPMGRDADPDGFSSVNGGRMWRRAYEVQD